MKIVLGADHRGFALKESVKRSLDRRGLDIDDRGCYSKDAVDYPDVAREVALAVSRGDAEQGILVCGTGLGMSIAANRYPRVRAALCHDPTTARTARSHNNANVLVLSGDATGAEAAEAILDAWLQTSFGWGTRHERRVKKLLRCGAGLDDPVDLYETDPEIHNVIRGEEQRQRDGLELIASENFVSRAVREAQGCVMTNKYAEGYPGRRWYSGCVRVDEAEQLAIDRARQLFGAEHANLQAHSGSAANLAAYLAVMQPGDTMMAMRLDHGGHLTHGHKVNFSGRLFKVVHYGVSPDTEQIDYDALEKQATESRPKLIVAGASAYPRIIDFERLRRIADAAGCLLLVDMAHIAGLVAAGLHPNPVPHSELVTTTTHKTLRGPRGGMILCRREYAEAVDRQVFPGLQGGPLMHVIAAKAVCLHEAVQPAFREYQRQVVRNAKRLGEGLQAGGMRIVSGGTDNHLLLADLTPLNVTGKDAAGALERIGVTVNKNCIPFDRRSPFVTSGIRIGTPAVTTRGMKEPEMDLIAGIITERLRKIEDEDKAEALAARVRELTRRFPMP